MSNDKTQERQPLPSPSSCKPWHSATVEQQPARLLSDQELNQLGAKLLRAEMMGDEVFHVFLIT